MVSENKCGSWPIGMWQWLLFGNGHGGIGDIVCANASQPHV